MKSKFSPVYLDDVVIALMGDEARPRVSRILETAGKRPDDVEVRWLRGPADASGTVVAPGETVDRTLEPTKAIYLRSLPKPADATPRSGLSYSSRPGHILPPSLSGDPVIAQLGGAPRAQGVAFPEPGPAASPPADAPVPPVRPIVLRRAGRAAKAQEDAEAEAEERQEEQRSEEDVLQDELEALEQAEEDDRHMY